MKSHHDQGQIKKRRKNQINKQIKKPTQEKWEKYNADDKLVEPIILRDKDDSQKESPSYTHIFLQFHGADQFLNRTCKRILQFGISDGKFIKEYKDRNPDCSVLGYDYSQNAIKQLAKNNIRARDIDLNSSL
jgi:tRNA G46 methylase TrmB